MLLWEKKGDSIVSLLCSHRASSPPLGAPLSQVLSPFGPREYVRSPSAISAIVTQKVPLHLLERLYKYHIADVIGPFSAECHRVQLMATGPIPTRCSGFNVAPLSAHRSLRLG